MRISKRLIYGMATLAMLPCLPAAESPKPMMKAVIVHEYGGPEVLKFEEVARPEPKENEVLVRVIGAGVNPADPLIVSGKYAKEFGTHLPLIPGYDIAGVKPNADQLREITKLIEGRKLKPIVTRMLPLANAVEAH